MCVCRGEAGSSHNFETLGCHEQLDPKDNQDSEDPREYCYGTAESCFSRHHLQMYTLTAATLLSPAYPWSKKKYSFIDNADLLYPTLHKFPLTGFVHLKYT